MVTTVSSAVSTQVKNRVSILDLPPNEVKDFLLENKHYCNFEIPHYINFKEILGDATVALNSRTHKDLCSKIKKSTVFPAQLDKVNYKILSNKDGKYAWRPFQLIHPILYVELVNLITQEEHWIKVKEQFLKFKSNPEIECISIPSKSYSLESDKAEQIKKWWKGIEQRSISLSLEYDYILHTDISNCYSEIYTHAIPWALHTKPESKDQKFNEKLLGNKIDKIIQAMSYGQTNGIPQGSTLMDFIAEIVLGYIDSKISEKIFASDIVDYKILRYRDDYRIFVNNPEDGAHILKILTEELIDVGLKLNPSKTKTSNKIIESSIKPDKLFWLQHHRKKVSPQKKLMLIYELASKFPNSGSLSRALYEFINSIQEYKYDATPLIAITVDIAVHNPRTYPYIAVILSKLLELTTDDKKRNQLIQSIINKFKKIPNIGIMELWLQRVTLPFKQEYIYSESLCKLVSGETIVMWNNDWLNDENKLCVNPTRIIDNEALDNLPPVMSSKEVELFLNYDNSL